MTHVMQSSEETPNPLPKRYTVTMNENDQQFFVYDSWSQTQWLLFTNEIWIAKESSSLFMIVTQ